MGISRIKPESIGSFLDFTDSPDEYEIIYEITSKRPAEESEDENEKELVELFAP